MESIELYICFTFLIFFWQEFNRFYYPHNIPLTIMGRSAFISYKGGILFAERQKIKSEKKHRCSRDERSKNIQTPMLINTLAATIELVVSQLPLPNKA